MLQKVKQKNFQMHEAYTYDYKMCDMKLSQ